MFEERKQFIVESQSREWSMAEVCRRFEVSRKTGYKWLARYESGGVESLRDGSHAPHSNPRQVSEKVEDAILEARGQHPHWGPVKLHAFLERTKPKTGWPAPSTIGSILHRHGLAVARKRRGKAVPNTQPLQHAQGPNLVWCADYKGWFRCSDGSRCDPLTISDAFSRFLLRCQVAKHPDFWYTKPLFEATFLEYGIPNFMRIDNGPPFASVGIGGLSPLSIWWIKLGICPERIEPGKPAQNGRHERMHRTLKQETALPPCANLREQQKAFDTFRTVYNTQRPHQALKGQTPADIYAASPRPYQARIRPVEYPENMIVRQISPGGQMRWNSHKIFVGNALIGEPIGLEPLTDRTWRVWFSFYELGIFDEEKLLIRPAQASTKR